MNKGRSYILLFLLSGLFFWKFFIFGEIPIDTTAFYQMRPWSLLSGNPDDPSASDSARYYHNIDSIIEVLPVKLWLQQHLRNGDVPLWIPSIFSGAPFAANHHAAPWDFSSILFLIFPADLAFALTLFLHLFIAGAATYFYCRVLDLSKTASLLASTGFMFNSFFLHWLGLISFNSGLIWLPLIPAGIELAIKKSRAGYFAISAAALGFVFLSGMAQFWMFNVFLLISYGLFRVYQIRSSSSPKVFASGLAAALVLGAAIGSVQILQTTVALGSTSRGGLSQTSVYEGRNHLSPRRLPTLLIPDLYGHHEENAFSKLILKPPDPAAGSLVKRMIWGEKGSIFNRTWGYVGLITFFLMMAASLRTKGPFSFYRALACGVIGFQVLLCWEPFHHLCARIWPAFDTLDHTRTIVLYCFSACILAARGLDSLESWKTKRKLLIGVPAAFLLVLAAAYFLLGFMNNTLSYTKSIIHFKSHDPMYASDFFLDAAAKIETGMLESRKILIVPAVITSAALVLLLLWFRNKISNARLCQVLLLVTMMDLIHRGWTDPPLEYTPRNRIFPPAGKIVQFLKKDPEPFRVYEMHRKIPLPKPPLRNYNDLERLRKGSIRFFDFRSVEFLFRPNTLIPYGINSAGGYMSLYPGRYKEIWNGRGMDVLKALRDEQSVDQWDMPWVGMQNIKYLLVPEETPTPNWNPVFQAEGVKVLQLTEYSPPYYGVPRAAVFHNPLELISRLVSTDFDPESEVLLEQHVPFQSSDELDARIQLVSRTADEIRLDVDFSADGFLVISENYFPGWKAKVDGVPLPILRANYVFQALPLRKGSHDIRLEFSPPYYKISLLCSVSAAILTLFLLIRLRSVSAFPRAGHD